MTKAQDVYNLLSHAELDSSTDTVLGEWAIWSPSLRQHVFAGIKLDDIHPSPVCSTMVSGWPTAF